MEGLLKSAGVVRWKGAVSCSRRTWIRLSKGQATLSPEGFQRMPQNRKRLSGREKIAIVKAKQSIFCNCRDELAGQSGFMFR
jgi:hypothetical protein